MVTKLGEKIKNWWWESIHTPLEVNEKKRKEIEEAQKRIASQTHVTALNLEWQMLPPEIRAIPEIKKHHDQLIDALPKEPDASDKIEDFITQKLFKLFPREFMESIGALFFGLVLAPIEKPPVEKIEWIDMPEDMQKARDSLQYYVGTNMFMTLAPKIFDIVTTVNPRDMKMKIASAIEGSYFSLGLNWMTWTILSELINTSITSPLRRYYARRHRPEHLTLAQWNSLRNEGIIPQDKWEEELKFLGYSDELIRYIDEIRRPRLSFSQLADGFQEGYVTLEEFRKQLELWGYRTEDIELLMKLYTIKKIEEPKKLYLSQLEKAYRKGSLSESDFRIYLEDLGYADREIKIIVNTIKLDQEEKFRDVQYNMILKAFKENVIDEMTFRSELRKIGYTDEGIDMITKTTLTQMKPKFKLVNTTTLKTAYLQGVLAEDEFRSKIIELGYKAEDAKLIIEMIKKQAIPVEKTPSLTSLSKAVREELILPVEFINKLIALGYTKEDAEMFLRIALYKEAKPLKSLSKAEILDSFKKGLFTLEQALDRLIGIGYSEDDADVILKGAIK